MWQGSILLIGTMLAISTLIGWAAVSHKVAIDQAADHDAGGGFYDLPDDADHWHNAVHDALAEHDNDHPWAGVYIFGDGLGLNVALALAPDAGFYYDWWGCLGLYDYNYGRVRETERGTLELTFERQKDDDSRAAIASEYHVTDWGERRYLIPVNGVASFANAVNTGSEPRKWVHGNHLLRSGDHERPADGMPELPDQYQSYLLDHPIDAEVTEILDVTSRDGLADTVFFRTTVKVNVGEADGVYPGLSLSVDASHDDPAIWTCGATITEVGEHESTAVFTQIDTPYRPTPELGWRLSTHPRRTRD